MSVSSVAAHSGIVVAPMGFMIPYDGDIAVGVALCGQCLADSVRPPPQPRPSIEILTVYMGKELGSRGIAVNAVAPGAIETDFFGGAVRDTPEFNKVFADMTALGRVGLADDIGPMIASLLNDDNPWVNAQRIEVSGGQGI